MLNKEAYLKIYGGQSLKGELEVSGAKNAILPLLFASLLVKGEQSFTNVPRLKDVQLTLKMLKSLGVQTQWNRDQLLLKNSQNFNSQACAKSASSFRASILILGPLLALSRPVKLPLPGGCQIGSRPIDFHIEGLKAMGAQLLIKNNEIEGFAPKGLKACSFKLKYPSVGATENLIMAGVLAKGQTYLENIACEPEILSLIQYLKQRGAKIERVKTRGLKIQGLKKLYAYPKPYPVIPDRIEAGTWLLLAACVRGEVLVKKCQAQRLTSLLNLLKALRFDISTQSDQILIKKGLANKKALSIKTGVYPAFPTDLQSQFMALMTSLKGQSVLQETIFEDRFRYVEQLNHLGAGIHINSSNSSHTQKLSYTHKAIIQGPVQLYGNKVTATDLRAGAGLIIAGLMAKGTTQLYGLNHIQRGYENFVDKLKLLKAKVQLIKPK